jgi:hypothetical protein
MKQVANARPAPGRSQAAETPSGGRPVYSTDGGLS